MKITKVSDKAMADSIVANIVNTIARKYGVKVDIDFSTYTINFDGPESKREAIALELDRYFD
jgi:hypothetical protein